MPTAKFTYHLHDHYTSSERADIIAEEIGQTIGGSKDAMADMIDRPFYEVALECEIDLKTGKVTILNLAQ